MNIDDLYIRTIKDLEQAVEELGTRASHGCVRLRWEDARWIATHCPDGTTVKLFIGIAFLPSVAYSLNVCARQMLFWMRACHEDSADGRTK